MKLNVQRIAQHLAISTSFFPFIYIYRTIYTLSILVASLLLRRVDGVVSIYLRRGMAKGEAVYGLSDIDLAVIVEDGDGERRTTKELVDAVYERISRVIPLFGERSRELEVYSVSELKGLYTDYDFYRHRFNEGKYTWQLLFGKDSLKALPELADHELYLPATEELKVWWALLNTELDSSPDCPGFKRRYLWYKAIAEASKVYLFICQGKKVHSREAALSEIRGHLAPEQVRTIDRVQGYIRHLTSNEDLKSDDSLNLFISLAGKAFREMERKQYADSTGKVAILRIPAILEELDRSNLKDLFQRCLLLIETELEPYLESAALIPQVDFSLDILSNCDIDSFCLVLTQKRPIPIEQLERIRTLFGDRIRAGNIEPFIVGDGNTAFSLQVDRMQNTVKINSPKRHPFFFAMLSARVSSPLDMAIEKTAVTTHCPLPDSSFEETTRKRVAAINKMISTKSVYKMRTLDFLRFFWAASRTKLLARSLESAEIYVPLTSRQTADALGETFPDDSDWLGNLHAEYTKALRGEENESYRFFTKSIEFLRLI